MQRKEFWFTFIALISASVGMTLLNLNESARDTVRDFLFPDQRNVLAKAVGDLSGHHDSFTVLKVKTRDSLAIEVYQNVEGSSKTDFRARYILPEKRDALFTFHTNAVRLILMDVNVDGSMEILTSAYDENLVPRMHVLHFYNDRNDFEELGPDAVKL